MEFAELMLGWQVDWPELFDNVLWSDEAIFHVGRFVNRHNCHYWASDDPTIIAEEPEPAEDRCLVRYDFNPCHWSFLHPGYIERRTLP